MIRLFIAFGEWLKLNFNVLSGNFISPCYQSILNDTEVRKIYRLEETKVAGSSGQRISTGQAGRSLFCLTGPTVNILASGYVEPWCFIITPEHNVVIVERNLCPLCNFIWRGKGSVTFVITTRWCADTINGLLFLKLYIKI